MDGNKLDFPTTEKLIEELFSTQILDGLSEFIKIPNLSPNYDPTWLTNGNQEKATSFLIDYANKQGIKGMKTEVIKDKDKTSILFFEIEAQGGSTKNHFMYGHFDKQPHFEGWAEGLGPVTPVIKDGKLYGRGGADDGYAMFACLAAVKAIQTQGKAHPRIVILVEGGEESGSPDLINYIDKLKDRIGVPDVMFCLDSGCLTYDTLWITTSLRGCVIVDFKVETMKEAVHSGSGGGIAPDTLMILRNILDRIENSSTGEVHKDFHVEIPEHRITEMKKVADYLGDGVKDKVKLLPGVKATSDDHSTILANSTWKPVLTVTGATGFPVHKTAGNVLRSCTEVRLSMRIPPTQNGEEAKECLMKKLTENPPFNAKVEVSGGFAGSGFNANAFSSQLSNSLKSLSEKAFGKGVQYFGEGGSIPFIKSLGEYFPKCELIVCGILGPGSNAHTVNEFLHIPYCKKLVTVVAHLLNDMA